MPNNLSMHSSTRAPSRKLTWDDAIEIWLMWWKGEFKHRIAAKFDVNVWRIYEVREGKVHLGSREAAEKILAERQKLTQH